MSSRAKLLLLSRESPVTRIPFASPLPVISSLFGEFRRNLILIELPATHGRDFVISSQLLTTTATFSLSLSLSRPAASPLSCSNHAEFAAHCALPAAMSKRALSPLAPTTSSSSSPSRSRQRRRTRFQLLHALPTSLLTEVCSFLSLYQVVSTLRSTCHVLHDSVMPDCLLQSRFVITSRSLAALAASSPGSRALISRVPSLSIRYELGRGVWDVQKKLLPLQALRSPLDASRFLFSSLSSLHVLIRYAVEDRRHPPRQQQSGLLSIMQLLAAEAESFSSLRRLHVDDGGMFVTGDVAFSSLARLRALTHCRIDVWTTSALPCTTLVSALSSLQSLTSLNLGGRADGWFQLLPLLCADAATPLLLRLRSLVLPSYPGGMDEEYDAFLSRLSSLPAPPALQRFSMSLCIYRAAGLLSVFSLPHLTHLDLHRYVRRSQLFPFISGFTSAPAPLVSLVLPDILCKPEVRGRGAATEYGDAAAVCRAVRQLLSRLTTLRRLSCDPRMANGLVAAPGSRPGDGASGCSSWLYSLTVRSSWPTPFHFPFPAPVSFPLLTELIVELPVRDAELEPLLSGCPQLLRLQCVVERDSQAVLIAARHCRCLMELTVRVECYLLSHRSAAVTQPESDVISPFLPQLITLCILGSEAGPPPFIDFSVLRHFTTPPHTQLRRVHLAGRGLTAQHVLSLACLPRLSHLLARKDVRRGGRKMAELEEARSRTRQQLFSSSAGSAADDNERRLSASTAVWDRCEDGVIEPPLGPHQQQEMRERVLKEAAQPSEDNLLASADGVSPQAVRTVFFAELHAVAHSDGGEQSCWPERRRVRTQCCTADLTTTAGHRYLCLRPGGYIATTFVGLP